jgi:hypothetical protein
MIEGPRGCLVQPIRQYASTCRKQAAVLGAQDGPLRDRPGVSIR